jgi:hypothetical protein
MHLLIEWYEPKSRLRKQEILEVLTRNINNSQIEKIHVFSQLKLPIQHDKINLIHVNKRQKILDLIKWANINLIGNSVIISNNDIFFDQTINILNDKLEGYFITLTRWEWNTTGTCQLAKMPHTTQDSWIFKAPIIEFGNYYFGTLGCDNVLAAEAFQYYKLSNPCHYVKAYHLHNSNYRTYSAVDRIMKKYIFVYPSEPGIEARTQTFLKFGKNI